jgi:signal transduction histidine kinase
MLMYAKPLSLDLRPVDVNAMLRAFTEGYALPGTQHRIRIETDPASPRILGDADRLQQILVNLTDNACQAAPNDSEITWRIDDDAEGHQVLISIHNGGEPIPERILSRLTEPFFSTKSDGTGLGLAIVRRLVEQHGGDLTIRSEPERGTEFKLAFPRLLAESQFRE